MTCEKRGQDAEMRSGELAKRLPHAPDIVAMAGFPHTAGQCRAPWELLTVCKSC